MENKIPDWVIEYNNANYQSSAGKAVKLLLAKVSEQQKEIDLLKKAVEEREQTVKDFNTQWGVTANQLAAERIKVSEQEKEIAAWKNVSERRAIEPQQLKKELSEQSQRIEALTKENERLHDLMGVEHCPSLPTCYAESKELDRLREERKELVEALREVLKTTLLMPELELKIEALLKVPNT